ncbi:MAG TPA: DUF2946 family protein [Tepidisphaeraceae bacterium]|nr:DUF2946 family protein [Tepidisphaeraceae bacterium]
MRFRTAHALLLAAIVYWTTGAALYIHERTEHADGDDAGEIALAISDHSDSSPGNHPKHHHDHDDCPTCQLLAHMQAHHVAPPMMASAHLPCLCTLTVTDRLPPVVDVHVFAPIRGPPVPANLFL